MKKLFTVLALAVSALTLQAQRIEEAPSSTFGLDAKDAKAVQEIRAKMAEIRKKRPTVALVLSGGGAKGAATVGVLKYMEQYDIPIDMVVGTSIGGLLGGMYSLGYSVDYLDSLFHHMDWGMVLSDRVDKKYLPYSRIRNKEKYLVSFPFYYKQDDYKNFLAGEEPFTGGGSRELHLGATEDDITRGSILGSLPSGFVFGQNVNHLITSRTVGYSDSTDFFKFPIPFACVATDMVSGKAKIWHSGSVNLALRSTMSIPGLFAPVRSEGMVLVDGGMRNNMPVNLAKRMGADVVIAIDLSERNLTADEIQNLADIMMASMDLFSNDAFNLNQRMIDIHIHPDMTGYNMLSFTSQAVDSLYARGYRAAEAAAPQFAALRKRLGNAKKEFHAKPAVDIGLQKVRIGQIEVVGVDSQEVAYILGGMQVKAFSVVDRDAIEDDISRIFGKGAYDYVNYELRGSQEPYKLRITCKRGPMHKLGLGARVDSEEFVSLLFNVGLNTNAFRGHSLDVTTRLSTHPLVDLLYAYNGRNFATMNVRANMTYLNRNFMLEDASPIAATFLQSNQEVFFSNMHWSDMDVKLGFRNVFYRIYRILAETGLDFAKFNTTEDYPELFVDGRVETLDNSYFPTRGVSTGIRGQLAYTGFTPDNQGRFLGTVAADITIPVSMGRFTLIGQGYARMIFAGNGDVPLLYTNMMGGDMPGRYLDHQIPFAGVVGGMLMDQKLFVARLEGRYRLGRNHYVSTVVNSAMDFDEFSSLTRLSNIQMGAGIGYAYNSIVGPFKFQLHWSSATRRVGAYIALGYNF
jgi:NTE family protein